MLLRLMKKQTDGSYKVVGYEKREGGGIRHVNLTSVIVWYIEDDDGVITSSTTGKDFFTGYIPHDRIDRYTGIDLKDGTKVFERDEVGGDIWKNYVIIYKEGAFMLSPKDDKNRPVAYLQVYHHLITKVTGIQGVTNV